MIAKALVPVPVPKPSRSRLDEAHERAGRADVPGDRGQHRDRAGHGGRAGRTGRARVDHGQVPGQGRGGGGRDQGRDRQRFEVSFGINHLGHFALTDALLGGLTASAPARVVTVASDAHYSAQGIDFGALRRPTRGITGLREYAVSKLCNVLFTQELARRVAGTGLTTYALHPGVVASDIWRRVPWPVRPIVTRRMLSTTEGAQTSLYCATSPDVAADSGLFYDKCAQRAPSPVAT